MNKFSKVTGLIAFWTELSLIIAIILLIFFQKSIVGIYLSSLDEYKDIFIVPWQEIIKNFIFFFLLGIFCLKSNSNEREYGILTLYFYILITIIFDNPFSVSALFIAMSQKGVNYLTFFSAFNSAQNSILYIFILIRNISFILSAGSMIVKSESRYLEIKNDKRISPKSRTSLILYSAFLGFLGIDRFYIGRTVVAQVAAVFDATDLVDLYASFERPVDGTDPAGRIFWAGIQLSGAVFCCIVQIYFLHLGLNK